MIRTLTKKQEALIPVWREEWRAIGLSTEPMNRELAVAGLEKLLSKINKKPGKYLYLQSPWQGCVAKAILIALNTGAKDWQLDSQLDSQLRAQLYSQLYSRLNSQIDSRLGSQLSSQLYSQLNSQLSSQLYSQLNSQLYSQLYSRLNSQIDSRLGSQLSSQLYSQLSSQIDSRLGSQLSSQIDSRLGSQLSLQLRSQNLYFYGGEYGHISAYWKSFYAFCKDVLDQTYLSGFDGYFDLAKSTGILYDHDDWYIFTDRPCSLKYDPERRLSCTSGPAIQYRDGWSVYAVHGVRVPEKVIEERDKATPELIEAETNQEVRRVMLDLYGMEKYFAKSGAKKINKDRFGELYEKTYPDGDLVKFVKVVNSTPEPDGSFKNYFLFTAPEVKTAHEAVARSFGMMPEDYNPQQET